ncbi:hypothetical protein RV18_GL002367 [Enterococcus termitis]|nr:hypothetical protein RV18_GL002367 [Enterococcus termitis]
MQVAKLTIIVGTLTNWRCEHTRFSKKLSQVELFYIFNTEYTLVELVARVDDLIHDLDDETSQFCVVLGNDVTVLN